jgi:hypothetical protein
MDMSWGLLLQTTAALAAAAAQTLAVLVAAAAVIVGIYTASKDRHHAADIAARDRLTSLKRERLRFDLETALRLSENLNRRGSTDRSERNRLGAESIVLIGALGRERVPQSWKHRIEKDDVKLMKLMESDELDQPMREGLEAQLALHALIRELDALERDAAAGLK